MGDEKQKRLVRNTALLYVRMFIVLLVTLYSSRVLLKQLGVEDLAIYNVVGSVVIFFGFLKNALTNATSRFLTFELGRGDDSKLCQTYSMAVNCHVILALALFVLLEIGGVWYINHGLDIDPSRMKAANWVFQFSLVTFCVSIIQTPFQSNIIAHEEMDSYAFLSIMDAVLKLAILFLLAVSPVDRLISYGFLMSIVAILIFLGYLFVSNRKFDDTRYIRYWDRKMVGEFASYSGWSLLVNAADITTQQCSSIFFFNILGSVANASLGFANQLGVGIYSFIGNFSQAYKPQIVKSYAAGNNDYFYKLIFSATKISFILYILVAVPIAANIDFVLKVWLDDYPADTPAFAMAVIAFFLFDSFQEPLWQAVHATGKLRVHQTLMAIVKVMAIPTIYFILKSGCNGAIALYAWAGLNVVCAIVRTIYMHFLIGLDLKEYATKVILRIFPLLAFVGVAVFAISRALGPNWMGLIVSTAVSVVLVLSLSLFVILDKNERALLKNIPVIGKLIK